MVAGPNTTLVLQKSTPTSDGAGGYTETWEDVRAIKGVLSPLTGQKQVIYDQLGVTATHSFVCEVQKGITFDEHYRFRGISSASGTLPTYYKIKDITEAPIGNFVTITLETGKGKNQN